MPSNEVETVQALFEQLMRMPPTNFPATKNAPLNVPTGQGVYVIEDADGQVLHVGRTKTGEEGLQQRLYDHMYATSSFAWAYVKEQGGTLCGVCRFRYVVVTDPRVRAFLEYYAIGRLCPKHFGIG
jgi:hypothetical protein